MPEGDVVWRTAHRLHEALGGRVIVRSDLRWPDISTVDLSGRTTLEVVSRGKHLLHRIEGGLTLHSHLRMEGQWRIEASGERAAGWERNHQLRALVAAPDWTALGLRLGMLDLVETSRESEVVGHLGPDLLAPEWDAALAQDAVDHLVRDPHPIGQALLDQRNLAGLGTMWAAETLFAQRTNPWTPANSIGAEAMARIVARARTFLTLAVQRHPGSSPEAATHVHGRSGHPCRRCGTTVRVALIGDSTRERTMFYCPSCQGGLGPTDDGRPQSPLGSSASSGRRR